MKEVSNKCGLSSPLNNIRATFLLPLNFVTAQYFTPAHLINRPKRVKPVRLSNPAYFSTCTPTQPTGLQQNERPVKEPSYVIRRGSDHCKNYAINRASSTARRDSDRKLYTGLPLHQAYFRMDFFLFEF